jgi:hypothetical protein
VRITSLLHVRNPRIPKIRRAVAVGSGTTVIFNPQFTSIPSAPEETSETNNVQVPFGSFPLNPLNVFERAALSKSDPFDKGSIARPSGYHVPVSSPLPLSVNGKVR